MTARTDLAWSPEYLSRFDWLREFAVVPADASPPLLMSPVPDDAVGSYGVQAVEWIEETQRIKLRWWQRLSIVRQLEHRADGTLCYETKVESAPRRAGKSVGLRGGALWRMEHAELFGEVQTVMHTGSDLAICREIHRGAWHWAASQEWVVFKGSGKESIETPTGDRWLVRAQDAVYGYDVCLAMVDEGWNVRTDTVTEGLEPAMLERSNPQLILTSTAHRRARSLMRTSLQHAITSNDPSVLLLLWAAPAGADPSDPDVWRAASPHWTEARRKMIAAKYEKALAGESDPEADDPDPMRGFTSQYLNIWQINEPHTVGSPITTADTWGELTAAAPATVPDVVAVESWFAEGVAVTSAWRRPDGKVVVSVTDHPTVAAAARSIATARTGRAVLVGASLADDPAWKANKLRTVSRTGTTRVAVGDFVRGLAESAFVHDGSELLTHQVLALRISPGSDGPRLRSTGRADAVKATAWAIAEAAKVSRMVLPSRFRS
jgi:hypothetical protein